MRVLRGDRSWMKNPETMARDFDEGADGGVFDGWGVLLGLLGVLGVFGWVRIVRCSRGQ